MDDYVDWRRLFRIRNRPINMDSPLEINVYTMETEMTHPLGLSFEAYGEEGAIIYLPLSIDKEEDQVCVVHRDGSLESLLTVKRDTRVMVYDDLLWVDEKGSSDIILYNPKSQTIITQFPKWSPNPWEYVIFGNRAVHVTPQTAYLSRYDGGIRQFVDLTCLHIPGILEESHVTKYYYILREFSGRTTVYDNHKAHLRFNSDYIATAKGRYLAFKESAFDDTYKLLNMKKGRITDLGYEQVLAISSKGLVALRDRENHELVLYDVKTDMRRETGIKIERGPSAVFSNDGTALFLRRLFEVSIVTVPLDK